MTTYEEALSEWLAMEPCEEDFDGGCHVCDDAEWDGPDDSGLKLECLRLAAEFVGPDKIVELAGEFYEFVAS